MQTTYDATTGDHVLTFEEIVPLVFVKGTFKGLLIFFGGIIGAIILGLIFRSFVIGVLTFAGMLWYLIWWANGKDGAAKFTTKITANDRTGQIIIDSGYRTQKKGWEPHRFHIQEVASVERKHISEEDPQLMAYWRNKHQPTAAVMEGCEVVTVVFADGQEVNVAWQESRNKAAQIQSETIKFLNGAKGRANAVQQHEQRLSTLAPGDEPL